MSTSSAAPKDLEDYARRARQLDGKLVDTGHRLNLALQAFRNSRPDYGAQGLDGLEGGVFALASTCGDLDVWVGEVGEAFRRADGHTVPVRVGVSETTENVGKESAGSRFWAFMAGTTGYAPIEGKAAGKDAYTALYVNPATGEPQLLAVPREPIDRPDGDHEKVGLTIE